MLESEWIVIYIYIYLFIAGLRYHKSIAQIFLICIYISIKKQTNCDYIIDLIIYWSDCNKMITKLYRLKESF